MVCYTVLRIGNIHHKIPKTTPVFLGIHFTLGGSLRSSLSIFDAVGVDSEGRCTSMTGGAWCGGDGCTFSTTGGDGCTFSTTGDDFIVSISGSCACGARCDIRVAATGVVVVFAAGCDCAAVTVTSGC